MVKEIKVIIQKLKEVNRQNKNEPIQKTEVKMYLSNIITHLRDYEINFIVENSLSHQDVIKEIYKRITDDLNKRIEGMCFIYQKQRQGLNQVELAGKNRK